MPLWPVPPLLPTITCGSVKVCRPPMVEMTTVNSTTGRSCGSVIEKNVRTAPAPSTLAASYCSLGIACRPAR